MHVFVHHVPFFIKKYGSLDAFQMEEVEHLNYVNKLVYFKSTNRGKATHRIMDQVITTVLNPSLQQGRRKLEICKL